MTDHPDQSAVNFAAERAALRREKIAARLALPADVHRDCSQRLRALLLPWLSSQPCGVVSFCSPIRAEPDCTPVILSLLEAGWRAAMPVVTVPDAPMEFRGWTPGTPMTADPHGIPVPAGGAGIRPTLILLPLVAFDAAGYRLGYGGGYFDRTLASLSPRPRAVGIGFDLARVPTIYPGPHDFPLDAVVTESTIWKSNNY